jgi:hypothetical protein
MSNVSLGDIWPYLLLAGFLAMVAWNCRGLLKRGNAADENVK